MIQVLRMSDGERIINHGEITNLNRLVPRGHAADSPIIRARYFPIHLERFPPESSTPFSTILNSIVLA